MDYEKIIKRSWQITKTNKFLWVFGMVLATLSGGFNLNSNYQLPGDFFQNKDKGINLEQTPNLKTFSQSSSHILGATTNTVKDFFSGVPIYFWIILGISLLLTLLLLIIITIIIREWARGSLITSIHAIEDQKQTGLYYGSQKGITTLKRFILLHILPGIGFLFIVIFLSLSYALLIYLSPNNNIRIISLILGGLVIVSFFIIGIVILSFSVILAEQLIVRKNLSFKQALTTGFFLAKKYLFQMLGMTAVNLVFGCLIGCLVSSVLLVIVILIFSSFIINKKIGSIALFILGVPVVVFFLFAVLFMGIFETFKISNWSLFTREIEKLEEIDQKK